jgi:ABC-type glycerol-3-phosphate transport system substrate-binding protein
MNVRDHLRQISLLVLAVALMAALAACSSGGDDSAQGATSTTTVSNTEKPGTARVTTFDVPASVDCGGKTSTTVQVQYATSGAKKQELYVDGRIVSGTDAASGTVSAPVHCDPLPHTFVMVAYDANGRRTPVEKKVTTNT